MVCRFGSHANDAEAASAHASKEFAPARGVLGDEPCLWRGLDLTTGLPYDVTQRPWYLAGIKGNCWTRYRDPVTEERLTSLVMPMESGGVVVAGSFECER